MQIHYKICKKPLQYEFLIPMAEMLAVLMRTESQASLYDHLCLTSPGLSIHLRNKAIPQVTKIEDGDVYSKAKSPGIHPGYDELNSVLVLHNLMFVLDSACELPC